MRRSLVIIQGLSFVALGAVLLYERSYRLAITQLLLAAITGLVYV